MTKTKKELLQQALDMAQRETVPPMAQEGVTAWWFAKGWYAALAQPVQPSEVSLSCDSYKSKSELYELAATFGMEVNFLRKYASYWCAQTRQDICLSWDPATLEGWHPQNYVKTDADAIIYIATHIKSLK